MPSAALSFKDLLGYRSQQHPHREAAVTQTRHLLPLLIVPFMLLANACGKKEEPAKKAQGAAAKKQESAAKDEPTTKQDAGEEAKKAEDAGKKPEAKPAEPKISPRERRTAPDNVAKAPASAKKTGKGIPYLVLEKGKGTAKPQRDDTVFVRFTAWDVQGNPTSTTWKVKSQEPRQLSYENLIPGWKDALGEMVEGERRLLWIPAKLAHLSKSNFKKGPRTVDLELFHLKIAPKAPDDVKRPPKDATKTKSGLAYKVLKKGEGNVKPLAADNVQVRYAGWQTDGSCFDHTEGDETAQFNLSSVVAGWTEGLQLMAEGDKFRMWLPQKIAYDGMPKKPKGMLVFDVELVKVLK